VGLGLSAPAAVPVEVKAADRRVFRLSCEVSEAGLSFKEPVPFEPGRPLLVRFTLPGADFPLELHAKLASTGDSREPDGERRDETGSEAGETTAHFLDVPPEERAAITAYVVQRLGLPPLP
jgi:hypothetical protein